MHRHATFEGIAIDPIRTGRIARFIFITAVISVVTLILLYSGLPIFGPINDFTNAINASLSAWLVWQFHGVIQARNPTMASLVLSVAWAGCAAIIVNSILVGLGQMHWMTGAMYTGIGFGLLGIGLLALHRSVSPLPLLAKGVVRLGYVAGATMMLGLLAGPALAADRVAESPLTLIAGVGAFVGWLVYPIWSLLLGRRLLRGE